jgi:hypothetical protein
VDASRGASTSNEPVQGQPETGAEADHDAGDQGLPAGRIEVEGAGGAHRPDEERVQVIDRVEKQQQGNHLEAQGAADQGGDQLGLPFQLQLLLGAALRLPAQQQAHGQAAGAQDQQQREGRAEGERQDARMQDHPPTPGTMQPSRIAKVRVTSAWS